MKTLIWIPIMFASVLASAASKPAASKWIGRKVAQQQEEPYALLDVVPEKSTWGHLGVFGSVSSQELKHIDENSASENVYVRCYYSNQTPSSTAYVSFGSYGEGGGDQPTDSIQTYTIATEEYVKAHPKFFPDCTRVESIPRQIGDVRLGMRLRDLYKAASLRGAKIEKRRNHRTFFFERKTPEDFDELVTLDFAFGKEKNGVQAIQVTKSTTN